MCICYKSQIKEKGEVNLSNSFAKDIDDMDIKILDLLQKKTQLSNTELSKIVNLSLPATHARLKSFKQMRYIDKYIPVLKKEKLNFDLVCIIFIHTQPHEIKQLEEFEESVIAMPQILECVNLTGDFDYMLKAILRNREESQAFIR